MDEMITLFWKRLVTRVNLHIKQWTKPETAALVAGILSDTRRCRAGLVAENALLRHQLIVLGHQVKPPQFPPLTARISFFWLAAPGSGGKP